MINNNSKDKEKADMTFLSFIHSCQMMQTMHNIVSIISP